jgi:putative addiction module component (TIGR02574 family)
MPEQTNVARAGNQSDLDWALIAAESLVPNDRLRLIARLWASLPADHWAAPTPYELHEFERQLRAYDEGRLLDAPWDFVRNIVKNRSRQRPAAAAKLYSAPRRFDLFTIMLVTAAYAVLLSGMSALGFPPVVSCYVAVFITVIAVGQALLSGLSMPRAVSVYTGIVAYFFCTISYAFVEPRFDLFGMIPLAFVFSLVFGSVLGYLAGVLVGGVFLVADVLRQRYGLQDDENELPAILPSEAKPRTMAHPLDDVAASPQ